MLGFGASQRNFAAAIVVATQAFDEPRVLVMTVILSVVAMLLLPFSAYLGRRKMRAGGQHAPPFPSR